MQYNILSWILDREKKKKKETSERKKKLLKYKVVIELIMV